MASKIFRRLTLGISIATMAIGSLTGCNSIRPQNTPTSTATNIPTQTPLPPTPTATISPVDKAQQQLNDTVEKFLHLNKNSELNSSEAKKLFSGELTDWDTPTIGEVKGNTNSVVFIDSSNAVVRIQIESGYVFDVYLYLSHDSEWTFTAIRAMALPGFMRQMYVELSDKTELSSEEQSALNEIKRAFLTDAEWRDFFLQNQSSFESLCAKATEVPEHSFVGRNDIQAFPKIQEEFTLLAVSTLEKEQNGNIHIVMDGITDNTVGFTCSPNNKPPTISSSQYIWVEEIIDGWYLFRTT